MNINLRKFTFTLGLIFGSVNLFGNTYADIHPQKKTENNFKKYKHSVNKTLNETIVDLANRLLSSNRIDKHDLGDLAITSFVDLHQLNKTTHFGRTLSETMFDELFIRGFNIADFRGQNTLSVNANGEYYITRDINKLNNNIFNKYILVGTYTKFEDNILINARILDNQNGKIVASARTNYHTDNCTILENCKEPRKIKIVTDGCSSIGCPTGCQVGICGDDNYNIKRDINNVSKNIQINDLISKSLAKIDQSKNFKYECIDEECNNIKKCSSNDPYCNNKNKNLYKISLIK